MRFWQGFWALWLVAAGVSFALITAIVSVKGYQDLRSMLRGLARHGARDHE